MRKVQTTKVYSEIQHAVESGYTTVSEQGSSRSGKTHNTLIFLVSYLLSHPKIRCSIVRETMPALRRSVWIDFREVLDAFGIFDEKALNKAEFTYTLSNGSWFEFFGCDSEQKIRGSKRDILYVNEGNELQFIEWQQLKMRTTLFTIVDYNPSYSEEHWLNDVNRDPRTYHFITTYKDNPFIEKTVIDEIESLKYKNKSLWRIYGLGLQAVVEGLIFKDIEIVDEIPGYVKRRFRAIDFGYDPDPTAIEWVGIHGDELWIDEICYRTEMRTSDIIQVLRDTGGAVKTISESADPRLLNEIYRGGINIHPVRKYPGSVNAGILKMQEMKIRITKQSVNIIKEFRNYTWAQDKEGRWLNVPSKGIGDHSIDGIRYVVLMEVLGGAKKPLDMARLANIAR